MEDLIYKIKELKKDCIIGEKTELKEDLSKLTSKTGGTFWGDKTETWPVFDSKPMIPILSILTNELPFKTNHFDNIALINVFAYEEGAPISEKEGSVVIRIYSKTENLQPLKMPKELNKPCFKINWKKKTDYPNSYQLEESLDTNDFNKYLENEEKLNEKLPNHYGIKIGGWPYLIQETYFLKFDEPEYVFQFDSNEVFMFCDSGTGYFLKSDKIGWNSFWDTM